MLRWNAVLNYFQVAALIFPAPLLALLRPFFLLIGKAALFTDEQVFCPEGVAVTIRMLCE